MGHLESVETITWPLDLAYGVDRDERNTARAVARARRTRTVADFVYDRVVEQAVFALLRKDYSIRQIAAALELPKTEVGRIAKRIAAGEAETVQEPSMIDMPGAAAAAREGIEAAWKQYEGPLPHKATLPGQDVSRRTSMFRKNFRKGDVVLIGTSSRRWVVTNVSPFPDGPVDLEPEEYDGTSSRHLRPLKSSMGNIRVVERAPRRRRESGAAHTDQ